MRLATHTPVEIAADDFALMLRFARAVDGLRSNARYVAMLMESIPAAAHLDPGWPPILMGYDFHLTPEGPRLIEINNNAGGLFIGRAADGTDRWLPQPELPELAGTLEQRLAAMFAPEWQRIVVMDEDVQGQFMYPEMCAYVRLLRDFGRQSWTASPEDLQECDDGLRFQGQRVDAIYNRHTDFYLESEALAHVRRAYLAGKVALNPYPRSYALIGDKARMVDWWRPGWLEQCTDADTVALIRSLTPETHRLDEMERERAWRERKAFVFKPAARHGGKGVVLGKGISRKRFDQLDAHETVVQQYVPPSEVLIEGRSLKLDVRLYMHGERLVAVAGRVWRGQVTNFREPGSGWVSLALGE